MGTLSALLTLCEGNPPAPMDSPHKWPVNADFFDVASLNTLLNKQSDCRRYETQWRSCKVNIMNSFTIGIERTVTIRTINSAYYLWWLNRQSSISSLGRVQSIPQTMQHWGKLTILLFTRSFVPKIEAKSVLLELTPEIMSIVVGSYSFLVRPPGHHHGRILH